MPRLQTVSPLILCSIVALCPLVATASEPVAIDFARAGELINEALNAQHKLTAYVTTDYIIRGTDTCTIRSYVANGPGRLRQRRTELTLNVSTKAVASTTYIANARGVWKVSDGKAVAVERVPALLRPIPRRLATAELLGVTDDVPECTVEEDFSYFGMPAKKITVRLSTSLMERLDREPGIMREALLKAIGGNAEEEEFERTWRTRAKTQFPSAYVYVIHAKTPFVLAWQAYSSSGELVSEIAHQEFKVMSSLPASLFEPPPPTAATDSAPAAPEGGPDPVGTADP